MTSLICLVHTVFTVENNCLIVATVFFSKLVLSKPPITKHSLLICTITFPVCMTSIIDLSYSRCQKAWHANKPQIQPSFFSFQRLKLSLWERMRISANIDMDTHSHTHVFIVHILWLMESGMHITWKHFIFILKLGLDDRSSPCHVFLVQLLLTAVAILSLLFLLNYSPYFKWPPLLFLHCWNWKDLWQSLQSLAVT